MYYNNLKKELKKALKEILQRERGVALCLGNPLNKIENIILQTGKELKEEGFNILLAYTSPEAYLIKLLKESPNSVIIVDTFEGEEEDILIFEVKERDIKKKPILTTHTVPLTFIVNSLLNKGKKVYFVLLKKRSY